MRELMCVFIGGGIGSTLRFVISMIWRHMKLNPAYENVVFPWPTFIANIIGCLLIGIFYTQSERLGLSPEIRLLLTTGLCGGFTTFSTFSYESISLLRDGMFSIFCLYVVSSLVIGFICAYLPVLVHNS